MSACERDAAIFERCAVFFLGTRRAGMRSLEPSAVATTLAWDRFLKPPGRAAQPLLRKPTRLREESPPGAVRSEPLGHEDLPMRMEGSRVTGDGRREGDCIVDTQAQVAGSTGFSRSVRVSCCCW